VTGCSDTPGSITRKTCTPLWSARSAGGMHATPAVANGVLYVGTIWGELDAFDAAGATGCSGTPRTCMPLWTDLGMRGGVGFYSDFKAPVVANGVVYAGSFTPNDWGLYAFVALTPAIRMRARHILAALAAMAVIVAPMPLVLSLAGRASTGGNYLLWQAFRRGNHGMWFYFTVVPLAVGVLVLAAAFVGMVWLRRENTWRERLLLCWVAVPVAFFTLWPVKGYQYLLPIAPALAVLAGRTLARLSTVRPLYRRPRLAPYAVAFASLVTVLSLAAPAWAQVNPAPTGAFLAGTGGLPGGREAGEWIRDNVPAHAQLLAIGPSMANVLQFYGGRRVLALSVSANPNDRNPAYVPVPNPDRALRDGEFQYIVWDSYTANRANFFAEQARKLVDKYHGVAVNTVTVRLRAESGQVVVQPVIVIYKVRAT